MNVDSTRPLEAATSEPGRTRADAKSSGFPALMDSLLGGGGANAKTAGDGGSAARERAAEVAASERTARGASREGAERSDRGERAREARDSRPARDGRATRDARGARDVREGRSAERERRAAEDEAEASVESREPAPEAEARGETSAEGEAPATKVAGEPTDPSAVVPTAEAPAWEVAAALALPELLARLSLPVGDSADAGEAEGATDEALDAGAALDAAAGGVEDRIEIGDAAIPDAPIVETEAREAAMGTLEAAQPDAAEADATTLAGTAEAARESLRVETGRALERAPLVERRLDRANEATRGDALEEPAAASDEVRAPVGAEASAENGSGDASQQPPNPGAARGAEAVERAGAETSAAVGATAAAVTTAAGESASKAAESLAAGGPDGLGAATATAAAPEANAPMPTERVQAGRAAEAITVQADWLATRGGGSARLVLNPPELGEIVIRVSVRQQNVDVVMVAQTALGHSMAQDQSDRLAQAFAHRDLRLDQFEVRRADPGDAAANGQQFGSSDAGQRERERAADREQGFDAGVTGVGRRRVAGASGAGAGAMVPPRGAAGDRARGIDLRI